jgi:undecaprenyl-diphosphatase
MWLQLDLWLFALINQKLTAPWADQFFIFISRDAVVFVPILALFIWLVFFQQRRGRILLALLILTATATDMTAYRIWKPTFQRLRPCHQPLVKAEMRQLVKCGGKYGMPSNHASNFWGAAALLILFYRRFWLLWGSFAGIIAYSRVYIGKHYPADVIVGALYGALIAMLIYYLWVSIRTRLEKQEKFWLSVKNGREDN